MKTILAAFALAIAFGTAAQASNSYTQSNGNLPYWAAEAFEKKGG